MADLDQRFISASSRASTTRFEMLVARRSYGFRTYEALGIALYHTFGRLPRPESTHKVC